MRMDVITLFPQMFRSLLEYGVSGRAHRKKVLECRLWDLRTFSDDPTGRIDDRPYGGGPGMVLMAEPLWRAVDAVRADRKDNAPVVYLSPQGRLLDQAAVRRFAGGEGYILIAGRYEGVDERWIELQVDEQWSIGRYVLSGGELPAMVLLDAVMRLQPGALGNAESARQDSFGSEGLADWPHYTRPRNFKGLDVPEVLLSGDHGQVDQWRRQQAEQRSLAQPGQLAKTKQQRV